MKGEDKDRIESLTKTLGDASAKMAERLYAQSGAQGGAQGGPEGGHQGGPHPGGDHGQGGGARQSGGHDDVVDAEFEEVKDDKK
jgi:molecular chaperone DnaK